MPQAFQPETKNALNYWLEIRLKKQSEKAQNMVFKCADDFYILTPLPRGFCFF